jgi:hypothetical protein
VAAPLACRNHPTRGRPIAPLSFTANGCLDIGTDQGSPVSRHDFDQAAYMYPNTIEKGQVRYVKYDRVCVTICTS